MASPRSKLSGASVVPGLLQPSMHYCQVQLNSSKHKTFKTINIYFDQLLDREAKNSAEFPLLAHN